MRSSSLTKFTKQRIGSHLFTFGQACYKSRQQAEIETENT